jgi:peroxiredoxin/tetratricopeptide (TPR) repeat protein
MKFALNIALIALIGLVTSCSKTGDSGAPVAPPGQPPIPEFHPGHSPKGQAFNVGPRTKGKLIGGTGDIAMRVSAKNEEARQFFLQGVGQLHGFWSFEAERSFRQAEHLEPNFPMAYWGMAMANTIFQAGSASRAEEFIQKAYDQRANASDYERLWIDATWRMYQGGAKVDKAHREAFTKDLADIIQKYPDEIEPKAMLALFLWENTQFYSSRFEPDRINQLIDDVLRANPYHPGGHHYRIHLNDSLGTPAKALTSASRDGFSASRIAHMSHMPGHTYWTLGRYADAAFGQEASARIDHRNMQEFDEWPYEIHNYLHNNQWLMISASRNGNPSLSLAIGQNLNEIPQHPELNDRDFVLRAARNTMVVLDENEDWERALKLANQPLLAIDSYPFYSVRKWRLLMLAHFYRGESSEAATYLNKFRNTLPNAKEAVRQNGTERPRLEAMELEVKVYEALIAKKSDVSLDAARALKQKLDGIKKDNYTFDFEDFHLDLIFQKLNKPDIAVASAKDFASFMQNSVPSLLKLVRAYQINGEMDRAKQTFESELRPRSEKIEMTLPLVASIAVVADAANAPKDWRQPRVVPSDVELDKRLELEKLGPLTWTPKSAPRFTAVDGEGKSYSLDDYLAQGKAVMLVFYLGEGCAGCSAQIAELSQRLPDFKAMNIDVLAISKEKAPMKGSEFPLLGNPTLDVFRKYGVVNDFETTPLPLHGLFLIDPKGKIRWSSITADAFRDIDFLKREFPRLLRQ